MVTTTGISTLQFKDIKASLIKDARQLISICNSNNGHLGDVVSGIRTTQSSMELKAKRLWEIFENQKQKK